MTYIHTQEGFVYLAVVMELDARNIVGWSLGDRLPEDLVLDALIAAFLRLKPTNIVYLHAEQGFQYSSRSFRKLLITLNVKPIMSRRGNRWDTGFRVNYHLRKKVALCEPPKRGPEPRFSTTVSLGLFVTEFMNSLKSRSSTKLSSLLKMYDFFTFVSL
ncbi:DDE-type integrase/transposase/recombinase [Vibrio barjaei]|uniref:DDE-type integrase/transposase/recombinase n=1 Tax=Vibrio barjaei TaxID=1676683 RepID=UPI0039905C7D